MGSRKNGEKEKGKKNSDSGMALTEAHFSPFGGKESGNSYGVISCLPARAQNETCHQFQ